MGVFETILKDGISRGHLPAKTQGARTWYRDAARDFGSRIRVGGEEKGRIDYGKTNPATLMKDYPQNMTDSIMPGSMYMYHYDPKHKDTLPYYDRFPLVFPFRVEKDRFWAINLHYLPLPHRAILMDALYDLANNKRYDATTSLKMSYKMLSKAAKFRYFAPCVKCYLISHLRTKLMYVEPEAWDVAIFLPTARWSGATASQVYAESKKKINKP